ncbi:S41 family peptidase [bacterium]|nr:S41 family peptidase [bacterium]
MKKKIWISMLALFVVVLAVTGFSNTAQNAYKNIVKLNTVLDLISKTYVEEVDGEKLVDDAIIGALKSLDPHSVYIPPKELKQVKEEFKGNFEGIGSQIDVINGQLTIVTPIPGSPSEKIGIQGGDKVMLINSVSTKGITTDEAVSKLRGPKGTLVHISIQRTGIEGLLEFDIIRDKIPVYSVDAKFMLDENTGYIRFVRFAETTSDEIEQALKELEGKGMKQLVLDMRNNGGGILEEAKMIVDKFLPGGKMIVYMKGRIPGSTQEFYSSDKKSYRSYPVVVLINRGSASASEIVAGAIQDLDRGVVVGERSFGKGLVQNQFDLNDGSAVRITIARYYTPSGRLIQRPYDNKSLEDYYGEARLNDTLHTDTSKVFSTSMGRKVFGGGGIVPDYFITDNDTVTAYYIKLWGKGVFRDFTNNYLEKNGPALRDQYKSNFMQFGKSFDLTELDIQEMVNLGVQKGIQIEQKSVDTDKDLMKNLVKAEIARYIWSSFEASQIRFQNDPALKQAVTYFPQAKKFTETRVKTK